ncbi:hypothetical protein BZA77DRAFT_372950 [Pyronema omphalodes]|nr:hypothetical protein BZA77DRAFT_372950 [Pyronema omphalodes]
MKLTAATIISLMAVLAVAAPSTPKSDKSASAGAPEGSDCYWTDGKTQKTIYGKWVCCKKEVESGALKSTTCIKHDFWAKLSKPSCAATHPTPTCCPFGKEFKHGEGCNDNPNAGVGGKH